VGEGGVNLVCVCKSKVRGLKRVEARGVCDERASRNTRARDQRDVRAGWRVVWWG